jgi:hypothetical protein
LSFGKFQCCHTLISRSAKQKMAPEAIAQARGIFSYLNPITMTAAPAKAAVA